jgi:hypothetical protein
MLLLLLQVFGTGPWHRVAKSLVTPDGLLQFGFLLLVAVLPASLPMTLVGGFIAARVTSKQTHPHTLWYWIARGCAVGFGLGALGSILWFGVTDATYIWNATWDGPPPGMMGPGRRETLGFVWFTALVGGLAGTLVGGAVATYCWRATRWLPPNNALQLTKPAQATELRS